MEDKEKEIMYMEIDEDDILKIFTNSIDIINKRINVAGKYFWRNFGKKFYLILSSFYI